MSDTSLMKEEKKTPINIAALENKFILISQVQIGETICTSDNSVVMRGTWGTAFKRWWYGDSRVKLVTFVKEMLNEYKTMLEDKEIDSAHRLLMKKKQAEAMMGFNKLKQSYATDESVCKELQEVIEQMNKLYMDSAVKVF